MTINLKQLIADREAGTDGPWSDDCADHDEPHLPIKIKSGYRSICSVWIDDAPVYDFNVIQRINARRIARLPRSNICRISLWQMRMMWTG